MRMPGHGAEQRHRGLRGKRPVAGSVAGRCASRQSHHLDAPPTAIVDQAFQCVAERIEAQGIDPLDQIPLTAQFHRVEIKAALVEYGDLALELCRGNGETDRRWRPDNVAG